MQNANHFVGAIFGCFDWLFVLKLGHENIGKTSAFLGCEPC